MGINLNGDVQGKAFVVGKESEAEVTANFKFKLGKLIGQKIDVNLTIILLEKRNRQNTTNSN